MSLSIILSIDEKTKKSKKDYVKIKQSEEWNLSESIPLWYLLSEYHRLPIWHMTNKIVIDEKEKNKCNNF